MIDVRLYAHLPEAATAPGSQRGKAEFHIEARPGLTVRDVIKEVGIPSEAVFIVMVNGERLDLDAYLADRDRLGLFPAVSGG
ncbi:MAG: MoaD/ThiS family protein [Thermoleophilia bacterium]|nr:MoaD/ThiS family protein [Thermoleophilia bacterium]